MAIHERVWDQPARPPGGMRIQEWKPLGTYTLLGLIAGVFVLQQIIGRINADLHWFLFAIGPFDFGYGSGWWLRPWTLITSTLAHSPIGLGHILVNGLVLYFMGPILERILGIKRFLQWFFLAGAISGVLQVMLEPNLALGASGAIMFVVGALIMIMPNEKVLFWGIVPMPFWALGILYAFIDIMGVIGPDNNVGNFAHLSGMALGLWQGRAVKDRMRFRLSKP